MLNNFNDVAKPEHSAQLTLVSVSTHRRKLTKLTNITGVI